MKVQKLKLSNNKITWVVLDDNYLPIQPIESYIRYLENLERSPNTIHSYASHLNLFWQFLSDIGCDWQDMKYERLADFITWLRGWNPKLLSLQTQESKRTESTINIILSAVCNFYDFHYRQGQAQDLKAYSYQFQPNNKRYKRFLQGIVKDKPIRTRLIKLKVSKKLPKTLTRDEVKSLIAACNNLRDKFLICLFYETGMRVGQALGLRHEDIHSWVNDIWIVPRDNNVNGARAKCMEPYKIRVSKELMGLYADYLINEYPQNLNSDYVFVNIWEGRIGYALTYSTVSALFQRLSVETNIKCSPHMFRHTHATELIRDGWNMALVQKRLGHKSIQTTIDTYTHITNEDLERAYEEYINKQK